MLKTIVKRDGTIQEFTPHKLNQWAVWSSASLGDRVDWSSIVMEAVKTFGEQASSQDLQKQLIKQCLLKRDWPHNKMAGRLYAAVLRKEFYGETFPTVKEQFTKLHKLGLMKKLNYTDEEYEVANGIINHDRDFDMAHFQIHQIRKKYGIQNRITGAEYETPQFTFMRMAMALADDEPADIKMTHVINWYDEFSFSRINAPTPNYMNLGTDHNGYASCNLYTTADDAASLAIGDHIAYTMTYMSAGIGGYINTRSVGDSVRNGAIEHQGKLPYFRALAGAVKANLQGGRGGACTSYYSAFDPEAMTIAMLQNPRTTKDKQNRDLHFAMMGNRLFGKKIARNEDIFVFTQFNAPELWKLFFSGDQDGFEKLYNELDKNPLFIKKYVSAREVMITGYTQGYEVATNYLAFIDEINRHTPFLEPIYSANLCIEIAEPTAPYFDMRDLYTDGEVGFIEFKNSHPKGQSKQLYLGFNNCVTLSSGKRTYAGALKVGDIGVDPYAGNFEVKEIIETKVPGEVALCSLAAINVAEIQTDKQYRKTAYYALKMIDKCIHMSDYALPHVGFTAKNRLNAGVGMIGVAYEMAKRNVKYSTPEGLKALHEMSERHMYFLIEQSIQLGKELGNAPWMHKTKWPEGYLPIDSYKRTVDELVPPVYNYDWEYLRAELIANKGMRFSCVNADMPTESSSKASGATNGPYPIRDLDLKKTDASNTIDWCAPDGDLIGDQYELAYAIPTLDMIKCYAVCQKFKDLAISADTYKDRRDGTPLSTDDMVTEYLAMIRYGLKGRYYQNSLTSSQEGSDEENLPITLEGEEDTWQPSECVGGCTL